MKKALERITNRFHLQALVFAAMIFAALTVRVYQLIAITIKEPFRLSIERTANWLSQWITSLHPANERLHYDLRHLLHDRRKRKTLKELNAKLLSLN